MNNCLGHSLGLYLKDLKNCPTLLNNTVSYWNGPIGHALESVKVLLKRSDPNPSAECPVPSPKALTVSLSLKL